jgi:heme/copper-type cytochrome/quinol oxidase subunit 2
MLLLSQIFFFIAVLGFFLSIYFIISVSREDLDENNRGTQLLWIMVAAIIIAALNIDSVLSEALVVDYLINISKK